ncbi:protein FAM149A-like isoform X2 [Anneissia japonica]|uniref:protein FAM149A-like isoform X2 n=1 Tax=Anneissia japonica TaxID=1529436 RepID=UPI00142598B8|nr:protein FAM149A-like isoform X2 [Anneissia japonica]
MRMSLDMYIHYIPLSRVVIRNKDATSLIVVGRGISSRAENHPLPEKPNDTLPIQYLQNMKEAISNYVTPSSSGRSSPTMTGELINTNLDSSTGWTSEVSSARSSLFSWEYDEFDKQAAKTVRILFDEIDRLLYEGQKSQSTTQLHTECQQWNLRFPHLRVLGKQLTPPLDDGFEIIPADAPRPATGSILLDVVDNEGDIGGSDIEELLVTGQKIEPISISPELRGTYLPHLEEEIFESDGLVEEYLAYDCRAGDEDNVYSQHLVRKRREGYPPITPNSSVQNAITLQVFDNLWCNVVVWLRKLVKKNVELGNDKILNGLSHDLESRGSTLNTVVPTFDKMISPYPMAPVSRLVDHANIKFGSSSTRAGTPSFSTPSAFGLITGLDDLMTIKSKVIHNRAIDGRDRPQSVLIDDVTYNRPLSEIHRRVGSSHLRSPSARIRYRLKPIDSPKIPSSQLHMEDYVQGKKLNNPNTAERLGSPPQRIPSPSVPWSKNAMLPPIQNEVQPQKDNIRQGGFPQRSRGSRISSAVHNMQEEQNRRAKEKSSRPNTPHTFRTDTPVGVMRRLSTPNGLSLFKQIPPVQSVTNTKSMPGITGVKVKIPSVGSHAMESYANGQANFIFMASQGTK